MSFESLFSVARSGMSAELLRLNTIASNLGHTEVVAGSPEQVYRSRHPIFVQGEEGVTDVFGDVLNKAVMGVRVERIAESEAAPRSEYRPNHPMADESGMVYLPNISAVQQMTDMMSSSRAYQAHIEMMNTGKQLAQETLRMGQ